MKIMQPRRDYFSDFSCQEFYHVLNRGNNGDQLFYSEENYRFFLQKFQFYVAPHFDVYSYCLLPNHFHFILKTRIRPKHLNFDSRRYSLMLSNQFRRFFICYSMAINRQEGRTGSLFQKKFKRIHVDTLEYLQWLIYYTHQNPLHHGITPDPKNYKWSSFPILSRYQTTWLKRNEVFEIYGGREKFLAYHDENLEKFADAVRFQEAIGMD